MATPALATPRSPQQLLRWLPWIGLVAVAALALAIGVQRPGHETIGQETTSIANQVRCPVCAGETAAASDTAQSVEIRTYIGDQLRAGQSRSQILAELSASYGSSILEKPQAKGAGIVLWVLPGVAVLAAVAGLGVVFARWRVRRAGGVSDDDRRLVDSLLDEPDEGLT